MPTATKEEQIRADTDRLHQMGYAQQLFRDMGGFSNFAISFTIISVLTGGLTLYRYGLNYRGPPQKGVGWGFGGAEGFPGGGPPSREGGGLGKEGRVGGGRIT